MSCQTKIFKNKYVESMFSLHLLQGQGGHAAIADLQVTSSLGP